MKASFIAVLLSLFVVTLPVHAESNSKNHTPLKQSQAKASKIDLNKADLAMLIGSFKGIGKKRAETIIAYREAHQGFKSIEELADVKGFGQHFVDNNRDKLKEVFVVN